MLITFIELVVGASRECIKDKLFKSKSSTNPRTYYACNPSLDKVEISCESKKVFNEYTNVCEEPQYEIQQWQFRQLWVSLTL